MSISNLSSAAVEHAPPQVVALNRTADIKPVEDKGGEINRPSVRPDVHQSARATQVTEHARTKASENAQVLRFDADKQVDKEQPDVAQERAERKAKEPDEVQLKKALDVTNQLSTLQVRQLEFTASKEDGRTIIKVVDKQNDEVIRQIPSEEFVKLAEKISNLSQELDSVQGLLFESKV